MRKSILNLRGILLSAILIIVVASHVLGQTVIVNNNFNSGTSYATLAPSLASNVSCATTSTETFSTTTGIASGSSAFVSNTTAGNALAMTNSSGTNTKYWTFQLGGSSLSSYKNYKLYIQAQRNTTGAQKLTIATSINGSTYTNFGTTITVTTAFTDQVIDLSSVTAINNQSSVYIRIMASGASGTGTLAIDNLELQATLLCPTLTASLTGGTSPICYNTTPAKFTASGTGGNGVYTYLWYKNGVSTSVTTQTYTAPALTANTTIYCAITSCGQTVDTSPFTVTVYGTLTAAISGGTSPVCSGTSPGTFTATASGGSGTNTYLWYKNGTSTGTTTQTYSPGNLTASTTIYCAVTSCGQTVNTSTFTVAIYGSLTTALTGGTSPICYNTAPAMFTATGTGGSGTYTYLWYKNGVSTGITTQTYATPALTANTNIYCAVTSCGKTVNTSTYSITVYSNLTAALSGGSSPICYNTAPAKFTATGTGGTGTYTYLWYKNGVSTGTTTQTYTAPALAANTTIYCVISCGCQTASTATYAVTVYSNLTANISGGTTPISSGTSPGTLTATGTGGSGSYTYLWYKNGVSTGITTQTYNPGNLTATTTFYCAITSCSQTVNTATITVNLCSNLTVNLTGGSSPICYNTAPAIFTATGTGGSGKYTYLWYNNGVSTGVITQTYAAPALTINTTVYCAVSSCGQTVNTSTYAVTVYGKLIANISGGTTPICSGTSPGTYTATATGGTGSYSYLWYLNNVSTGVTTQTYNPGNLTASSTVYCATTSNPCGTVNTPTISINVNPLPVGKAGKDTIIFPGVSVILGSTSISGNKYFWTPSTGLSNVNASNPSACPLATTKYHLTVTNSTTGCSANDSITVQIKSGFAQFVSGSVNFKVNNNPSESISYNNPPDEFASLINKYGITSINNLFNVSDPVLSRIYTLKYDTINNIDSLISDIKKISYIEYVEKVPLAYSFTSPNDPLYSQQYSLSITNAQQAWTLVQQNLQQNTISDPVIAIIDNHFMVNNNCGQTTHEDLAANLWNNPNPIMSDYHGYDFGDNDNTLDDPNVYVSGSPVYNEFHGTCVAGVADATTNNSLGLASMGDWGWSTNNNPNHAQLMCLKYFPNGSSTGSINAMAQAIIYAVQNKANVINISSGSEYIPPTLPIVLPPVSTGISTPGFSTLQDVVNYAHNANVLVVAAAGNYGNFVKTYPCSLDNVICVGATNLTDNITQWSNMGPQIDVMAPGNNLPVCWGPTTSSYSNESGTSLSSPLVAGLAGLAMTSFPYLPIEAIQSCIESSCDNIDALNVFPLYGGGGFNSGGYSIYNSSLNSPDNVYQYNLGHGRINAEKTIECLLSNINSATNQIGMLPSNPCSEAPVYLFYYSNVQIATYNWSITPAVTFIAPYSNTSMSPRIIFGNTGSYSVKLTVTTSTGATIVYNQTLNITSNSLPTATIQSSMTNFTPTCDGSSQSIDVQFTGTPPFNITLSDGATTKTFSNIDQFQSTLYWDVYISNPTITATSVTDYGTNQYCHNVGNSITFTNIVKCCSNKVNNGDFEENLPAVSLNYPTSASTGNVDFFTDYKYCQGGTCNPNTISVTTSQISNPYFSSYLCMSQHGQNILLCDGYYSGTGCSNPIPPAPADVWRSEPISVNQNQDYYFSFWVNNAWDYYTYVENFWSYAPQIELFINNSTTPVNFDNLTGTPNYYYPVVQPERWNHLCGIWNSGSNTTAQMEIRTVMDGWYGNDFALDNIELRCIDNFNVVVSNSVPICSGSSTAQLTAISTGGAQPYTYNWSPSTGLSQSTISNPIANPSVTTTYGLTATDANGCTSTGSVTVIVNTVSITTNPNQPICQGESQTLTAMGGGTYLWSNSAVTSSIVVSPTTTTVYSVTVTGTNSCTATGQVTVSVNPPPAVTINGYTPPRSYILCTGNSITLTGGGASNYIWSNGSAGSSITVSPTTSTFYTVTGTTRNGCSNTAVVQVSIMSLPSVTVSASANPICSGETTTLTASGATTYSWNNGSITNAITVSPTTTTTYSVTGSNLFGCDNTASITVIVNSPPTVTINGVSPSQAQIGYMICTGNSITFTAGGASTYVWSGGLTNNPLTVSPTASTTYHVTGTDANGCTNTASVQVIVNSLPNVTVSASSNAVCSGSSVTLTASGALIYNWSNGSTSNPLVDSPTSTTVYTVTGSNLGCANTASVTVTVNPLPIIAISATANPICPGSSTILTPSGASNYTWNTGSTAYELPVSPTVTTTYTVTGTIKETGCTNSASITVIVNTPPTVTINGVAPSQFQIGYMICTGNSITLTGGGASTYVWSGGLTSNPLIVSPTVSTTYHVTGTDGNGCTNTASVQVAVRPLPVVTVSASSNTICSGSPVTLTAGGALSYSWSNGATGNPLVDLPISSITYSVTGTSLGCANTASVSIIVPPLPAIFNFSGGGTYCEGSTGPLVTLDGSEIGVNYQLQLGGVNYGAVYSGTGSSISGHMTNPGTYTVVATNAATGCSATMTGSVTIIEINCDQTSKSLTAGNNNLTTPDGFFVTNKLSVYPNPTSNKVTYDFYDGINEEYQFKVIDINGKVIISNTATSIIGYNSNSLDLELFGAGVYILCIQTKQNTLKSYIVKE